MFKRLTATAALLILAQAVPSRAAELKDFPAQTHWILSVDVKAAHASPLMNALADKIDAKKRKDAENKLAAVKAAFGVDLLKDIEHIVIAGNGNAEKGGVAYVYGTFDTQRLTTILTAAEGFESTNHNGVAVMSWIDEKDKKPKSLCFAKPGLALISNTRATLIDALDVLCGKKAGFQADSPLSAAIVRNAQNLLTLQACDVSAIVGAAPKAEALKQAETLSLCVRTPNADTLDAELSVTATSEATALQIQQALLGIQAIALLRAAEAPQPATLAQQAKIACNGRTVGVKMTLPKELIELAISVREAKQAENAAAPAPEAPAAKPL